MAQASTTEQDFFGNEPLLDSSLQAVEAEIEPETYSEFYDLVTERLFKTSAEEGIGFLGKYIERRGSFWGLGSVGTSLRKHSYLQEDVAKSHPNDPDRIEEALVQLRDMKRENGRLTLDDVVATSYPLADEFDRRATFLLAYELGYLEPQALGVSITPQPPLEMRKFFAAAGMLAGSPRLANMQFTPASRSPTKTEGEAYVADILQWMDRAASKNMPFKELIRGIHFFLINSLELYATAVHDIKQKNYTVAQIKLTGLRAAADKGLANIEGPIVYQLAQIALATNDLPLAEKRLRETVMMSETAFPVRYGVKQEDAYKDIIALYLQQKKTPEALWALGHLQRYYPKSALLTTHKKYVEEHAFAEGKSAFSTGDLETAVNCFRLETSVKPKNSWAWYYLGMTEHKKKKGDLAQAAFDQALTGQLKFRTRKKGFTHIRDEFIFLSVIDYYMLDTKQYDRAARHLEHGLAAIDKQQKDHTFDSKAVKKSNLYFLLAKSYQEQSKSDAAYIPKCAQAAARARKCAPHHSDISQYCDTIQERCETLGKKQFDSNHYSNALPYLQAAQTLGASSEWLIWRIGRCYEVAGDYTAANAAYQRTPDFKNAQIGIARIKKVMTAQKK